MVNEKNISNLMESMKIYKNAEGYTAGKHTINKVAVFFPFETRNPERPKFKRKFLGVLGELVRLINQKELNDKFSIDNCIENIANSVQCKCEEDRKYLKDIIRDYLVDVEGDIKVFHPDLLNYIQLTDGKESVGEKKIAQFLYDLVFDDNVKFKEIFKDGETKNVITKLILTQLDGTTSREVKEVYKNNLVFVTEVAKEDFYYLLKHKDYLLKNFQKLTVYYYFYYITQLSIKINKRFDVSYDTKEELYYLLDWEKASGNRRSVVKGYEFIKSESKNLLVNINVLEHLNFLFGVENLNYREILEKYRCSDEELKSEYIETIKTWICFYRKHYLDEVIEIEECDFSDLVRILEDSISRKVDKATVSRYSLSIEEVGKKYFLKYRGSNYKYMLNMTQEMLLTITAVCIKDKKITLKNLFNEYERRGIFFDQYSKDEVVELLGKLNLIDKKSDSGDAQYVKSIL